jgi:hypothetical protein
MKRAVVWVRRHPDVSEEHITYIFRGDEISKRLANLLLAFAGFFLDILFDTQDEGITKRPTAPRYIPKERIIQNECPFKF